MSPLFAVEFWTQVLEAASKALRGGAVIPEKGFHEVQSKVQDILNYAASLWISSLANSPDSQMDLFVEFLASSFPAPAGIASLSSSSANPSVEGTSPMLPFFDCIAGGLGTEGERSSPSVGSVVPLVGGRESCLGREMVSGAGVAGAVAVMEIPSGRQVHEDSKSSPVSRGSSS